MVKNKFDFKRFKKCFIEGLKDPMIIILFICNIGLLIINLPESQIEIDTIFVFATILCVLTINAITSYKEVVYGAETENEILVTYFIRKCPFCNGDTKLVKDNTIIDHPAYQVRCKNIDCAVRPKTNWFNDKMEAVERWNRRY